MSDDTESKGNCSASYNNLKSVFSDMSDNQISQIVYEMVEVTCKNIYGKDVKEQIEIASVSDKLNKNAEQKFEIDLSLLGENDIPVRRSNRIRKSVVKKNEIVSTRAKKANKNHKNSETLQLKTVDVESKTSDSDNQLVDISEKMSEKHSKSRGDTKIPKNDKTKAKSHQNGKRCTQSEKKKTARKKKRCNKNEEFSDTIDPHSKNDDKTEIVYTEQQSLISSCSKTSDVTNCEYNKTENHLTFPKVNDDQSCEVNDKSSDSCNIKPVKVKSRWWRSSELEAVKNLETTNSDNTLTSSAVKIESLEIPLVATIPNTLNISSLNTETIENPLKTLESVKEEVSDESKLVDRKNEFFQESEPPPFDHIEENIYRFNRKKCKSKKQVRRMVCDCTLTKEEQEYGIMGCKEECLNRLLMIECGSRCPIGEACSNRKFQKKEYVKAEIFKTEKKGWGLRTLENTSAGDFLMEFVGEILNHKEYRQRVKQYAKEKNVHSYFMALKTDEILDATCKGNLSRFINHSCNPNCETQKWTVNGELRVGVFSKQTLQVGEELTLDYKFQRYGREAQKCYCGAENCSGFIGGAKQISIDAYSGAKSLQSRKRKGSEDKKREWEDMILEEEIEKLNGNRGLRNRDDTLKLARLMVRADDSTTRHQLLDIILKTEEQACLRLFLDYHGLPLLWSWMTDVVEFDLKAKILQVLSLLPISNKTMLLDSKVMSIVEKWNVECSSGSSFRSELCPDKSSPLLVCDDTTDSVMKKIKIPEFSDSETDSTSSHTVVDLNNEGISAATETNSKTNINISTDEVIHSETSKESSCDRKECNIANEDPDCSLKLNIAGLASGLLNNWKNLKEVFRIPRLEQQKRKEDEMEVDNNAKEKVQNETSVESPKCGDQIQVVISGKNLFSDHHRAYDYEQEMKLEECPRRLSHPRTPPVLAKPRQINKPIRRHPFPKQTEKELPKVKEDTLKCSPDILSSTISPAQMIRRAVIPPPNFSDPPPVAYPPSPNISLPPPQPVENPSLIYPPQIMYSQSQLPFMGSPAPVLPHNPTAMPPPTSVTSHPPLIQQPPLNTGLPPPCQPLPPNQSTVGAPPNANNFLLPQNVPPPSVVPGSSQFLPGQTPPIQTFPPGPNVFTTQNQPMYFMPPQTSIPNNPPPSTFPENIPVQQSPMFPVQPVAPVKEEPPKPVKLPKNWRTATDSEGNVYYYHSITRHTQWDPPSEDDDSDDDDEDSNSEESESSDTPTYDEPKVISTKHSRKKYKKRKPTKAAADTSVAPVRPEVAKKIKELFRTKMSSFIVCCLNAYRKPNCTVGRITSNEDFKYLARKLTHYTMTKELKQCKNVEDLDCNETVMHKAKDFIKKYMAKYGSQYIRKEKGSPAEQ